MGELSPSRARDKQIRDHRGDDAPTCAFSTTGIAVVLAPSPFLRSAQLPPRAVSPDDWPGTTGRSPAIAFHRSPTSRPATSRGFARCAVRDGRAGQLLTGPVVVNGAIYLTSDRGTFAIDAATCAEVEAAAGLPASSLQVNRGVAYDNGRVSRRRSRHVIALDAATGATADIQLSPFLPGMTATPVWNAWCSSATPAATTMASRVTSGPSIRRTATPSGA